MVKSITISDEVHAKLYELVNAERAKLFSEKDLTNVSFDYVLRKQLGLKQ